jgi:hypothetical protein
MFTLGQLSIGPSIDPAAAVLTLVAHGVAAAAAAGVLLTVTATLGSLCYAAGPTRPPVGGQACRQSHGRRCADPRASGIRE